MSWPKVVFWSIVALWLLVNLRAIVLDRVAEFSVGSGIRHVNRITLRYVRGMWSSTTIFIVVYASWLA